MTERQVYVLGPLRLLNESKSLLNCAYDTVSANVIIWVLQMGESESGQIVSEKVKWA